MIERLQDDLIAVEDENPLERGNIMMETKSHQLQKDIAVVVHLVVGQARGIIRYHCSVLGGEGSEVLGGEIGSHEDDDSVGSVEDIVQAIDVHENGAGIVGRCRVEYIGKRRRLKIWFDNVVRRLGCRWDDWRCPIGLNRGRDVAWTGESVVAMLELFTVTQRI